MSAERPSGPVPCGRCGRLFEIPVRVADDDPRRFFCPSCCEAARAATAELFELIGAHLIRRRISDTREHREAVLAGMAWVSWRHAAERGVAASARMGEDIGAALVEDIEAGPPALRRAVLDVARICKPSLQSGVLASAECARLLRAALADGDAE